MLDKAKHLDFDLWSLDVDVAAINVNEVLRINHSIQMIVKCFRRILISN